MEVSAITSYYAVGPPRLFFYGHPKSFFECLHSQIPSTCIQCDPSKLVCPTAGAPLPTLKIPPKGTATASCGSIMMWHCSILIRRRKEDTPFQAAPGRFNVDILPLLHMIVIIELQESTNKFTTTAACSLLSYRPILLCSIYVSGNALTVRTILYETKGRIVCSRY